MNGLKIWRFTDPIMGPRKLPVLDCHEVDKVLLGIDGHFDINVDAGEVYLRDDSSTTTTKPLNIGTAFIYVVE